MAGHSKWANIKHRKGRQDEKKQKIFSKFIRELTVASRLGGPIAADNPRLRLALDKALGANMPCLLYTSPSPRDPNRSRMPSSA